MKIILPVYGRFCCGDDVALSIQIKGSEDMLVVRCKNKDEVWGDSKGIYSKFGIVEFDTDDVVVLPTNISSKLMPCISYKDIKFEAKTAKEMREWFYEHYTCFED